MQSTLPCILCCFLILVEVISFSAPDISPATNCKNEFFSWKQQQIRYQQAGPKSGPPVLLVHGLFVNSDHWRKTIKGLSEAGCHVFAIDLLGYGYSSKPKIGSTEAEAVNGESGRPDVQKSVALGSADGRSTRIKDIDLKHPTKSPFNFYTWSSLIVDFTKEVIAKNGVCLVANSIGSISVLQVRIAFVCSVDDSSTTLRRHDGRHVAGRIEPTLGIEDRTLVELLSCVF